MRCLKGLVLILCGLYSGFLLYSYLSNHFITLKQSEFVNRQGVPQYPLLFAIIIRYPLPAMKQDSLSYMRVYFGRSFGTYRPAPQPQEAVCCYEVKHLGYEDMIGSTSEGFGRQLDKRHPNIHLAVISLHECTYCSEHLLDAHFTEESRQIKVHYFEVLLKAHQNCIYFHPRKLEVSIN